MHSLSIITVNENIEIEIFAGFVNRENCDTRPTIWLMETDDIHCSLTNEIKLPSWHFNTNVANYGKTHRN